ncbi:MAG: hypothetical protein DMF89_01040, partial [Acidobacteria bacterium]
LTQHFLERHRSTRVLTLSDAAAEALVTYEWPGNVRELERLIEGAVALVESDVIEMEDLPLTVGGDYMSVLMPSVRRDDTMRAWGSRYATLVLARCHGSRYPLNGPSLAMAIDSVGREGRPEVLSWLETRRRESLDSR